MIDSFILQNLMLTGVLEFSVGMGGFVIGLGQISFFSLYQRT